MSIEEIKRLKLASIQNSLNETSNFQFTYSLTEAFKPTGTRHSIEPIWLRNIDRSKRLEPIINVHHTIQPIMTNQIVSEEIPKTSQKQDDPMEIDTPELTSFLENIHILTESSSQIQADVISNIIKELIKFSPVQLEKSLVLIDFPSWLDDATLELLNVLMDREKIPTANTVYFVHKAVFPKIVSLQSSAPRLLMNSILQFAKKEGKCIMDGLVLPLLFLSDISRPQTEVILKITSESLNPTQRYLLFKNILDDGESYFSNNENKAYSNKERKYLRPWKDTTFQFINTILSTQPFITFTKSSLMDLLQSIQTVVQSDSKDKGSMQILLLLTSKYPQTLVDNNAIELIENICQISKMFLKRAVLGQITTLKKNLQALKS